MLVIVNYSFFKEIIYDEKLNNKNKNYDDHIVRVFDCL
jgi:hypothetical protein